MYNDELKERAHESVFFKLSQQIILSSAFNVFIFFCIIFNVVILALDRFDIDKDREKAIEISN